MAELMREVEGVPESWPVIPEADLIPITDITGQPVNSDLAWVWQRIEAYSRERWTPREVVWLVQGGGAWTPPLSPVRIEMMETWAGDWMPGAGKRSPWGSLVLSGDAHRITGIVGENNPVPPVVMKAAARLANYLTQQIDGSDPDLWATKMRWIVTPPDEAITVGEGTASITRGHKTEESYERAADYIAKALQYSGAADLLRPYRRMK